MKRTWENYDKIWQGRMIELLRYLARARMITNESGKDSNEFEEIWQRMHDFSIDFARVVIDECGFKSPPICDHTIADYLGVKLIEFTEHDISNFPNLCEDIAGFSCDAFTKFNNGFNPNYRIKNYPISFYNIKNSTIYYYNGTRLSLIALLNYIMSFIYLYRGDESPGAYEKLPAKAREELIDLLRYPIEMAALCCARQNRRSGIFHEFGHVINPLHHICICRSRLSEGNHLIKGYNRVFNFLEGEAYMIGDELLMPASMFVEDILSLETSFLSILRLSQRYEAPVMSTAINYVRKHPGFCGLVSIIPVKNKKYLKVRALFESRRFQGHLRIRIGSIINEDNPIYSLIFKARSSPFKIVQEEIPPSVLDLDSSDKWIYRVECIPWKYENLVLLSISDY